MKHTFFSFLLLLLNFLMIGQGNYSPVGADFSYPRTIIDQQEIAEVRNSLSDSLKSFLYSQIITTANFEIPVGNESYDDRIRRSYIAREAAFVLLMDRKISNNQIIALTSEDRTFYLDKAINLLENLNDSVGFGEGFLFHWEWQLRSPELMNYLIAYDLLKGLELPDTLLDESKNKIYQFSGNFYKRTSDFYPNSFIPTLPLEFYSYKVNNHAIISCSTLGIAAIVLGDETSTDENFQPSNWMQAAMYNLDNTLWQEGGINPRVSESGVLAGYAEGPNYFHYAFKNTLPFIRSMWNFLPDDYRDYTFNDYNGFTGTSELVTRNLRNPWYDENYHNLYEWMNRIRMPDGRYPAIHDSGRGFKTMLTALSGMSRYNIPNPKSNYNSIWVRSQFISTLVEEGSYDEALFQALPEAGSLIFRSAYNDIEGVYMHMIGKNDIPLYGAKGHHQADATSFQLYFNEEDLVLDPGYSGSNYRGDVEKATDHNLILVNGNGPSTPSNEFVANNNTTYIENYFDMPSIDYGELRAAWQEANISRKTLFVNNQYFIITDFVKSDNLNNYTFQLHGNGLFDSHPNSIYGAFLPDFLTQSVTYTRNNSNLLAKIISRGETTYSHQLDSLSLGANGYQEYSKTLVSENEVTDTEFLAVLFPYKDTEEPVISIIPTTSLSSVQTIFTTTNKDLIFVKPDNELEEIPSSNFQLSENIAGNGNINFVSFNQNDIFKKAFLENGSRLWVGDKEFLKTDVLVDIVIEKNESGEIEGYINQAATVEIYSDSSLIIESGSFSTINYDSVNHKSIITFNEGTYFKLIQGAITPTSIHNISASDSFEMSLFPNPTTDQTSISIDNLIRDMKGIVSILDITGKVYFEKNISLNKGQNIIPLSLQNLPPGLLFISLKTENNLVVKKITKIN